MHRLFLAIFALTIAAHSQWQILDGHTKADLRGIDNVGGGVAWASGSNGTVLRTEDGGYVWQLCAVPPDAAKLDFRGIQAFDNNTAIVMSSGPGDLSRLYKTTDGCQTWKLVFTNPDKDGFWDALRTNEDGDITILGDPIQGHFRFYYSVDAGLHWNHSDVEPSSTQEGAFAASNSSFIDLEEDGPEFFGTGAPGGARLFHECFPCDHNKPSWTAEPMSMFAAAASGGIFSLAARNNGHEIVMIALGGDYARPAAAEKNAAYSSDRGIHWTSAMTQPHGYRSAVAYDEKAQAWITVGPNGTDVSTDDGRNWRALKPAADDAPDADKNWNALSLPFVVGPKGRIGVLRNSALKASAK